MRSVPLNFCVAKIQEKHWQAIVANRKTVEIRDEYVDADYFIFTPVNRADTIIGIARVAALMMLQTGSTRLPEGANVSMSELESIYPNNINNGMVTRDLYVYRIIPVTSFDIVCRIIKKLKVRHRIQSDIASGNE